MGTLSCGRSPPISRHLVCGFFIKCLIIMFISTNIYRPYVYDPLTNQDHEVVENTRSRVKIKSKLTNFKINSRIEGYNGKYGSNPQGVREILDDLIEFDQIR